MQSAATHLDAQEKFMLELVKASQEKRISWQRVISEEEPDRDVYRTLIQDDLLEIEFDAIPIVSRIPPGKIENVVEYALVTISGMKQYFTAAIGTSIFALAQQAVSVASNGRNSDKSIQSLLRAAERISNVRQA